MSNFRDHLPCQIRYIYDQLTIKPNPILTTTKKTYQNIIEFIQYFNDNHKFDHQWFHIVYYLIKQFKLSVVYFLQFGFKKLYKERNKMLWEKYEKEIRKVEMLICGILGQVKASITLEKIGLGFVEAPWTVGGNKGKQFNNNNTSINQSPPSLTSNQIIFLQLVSSLQLFINQRRYFQTLPLPAQKLSSQQVTYQIQSQKIYKNCYVIFDRLNLLQKIVLSGLYEKYEEFRVKVFQRKFNVADKKVEKRRLNVGKWEISNINTNSKTSYNVVESEDDGGNKHQIKINVNKANTNNNTNNTHTNNTKINTHINNTNTNTHINTTTNTTNNNNTTSYINNTTSNNNPTRIIHNINNPKQITIKNINTPRPIQSQQQTCQQLYPHPQRLCCRPFFYRGQKLCPQSLDIQYKQYSYPWTSSHLQTLGRTICSFLNSHGGNIYIGVYEDDNFQRTVIGQKLDQKQKEDILKSVRAIVQNIRPDCLADRRYQVNFVPVKIKTMQNVARVSTVLKNTYLIKISVNQGSIKDVYVYCHNNNQMVCFRSNNQLYTVRSIVQILEILKRRVQQQHPLQKLYPHENSCQYKSYGVKSKNIQIKQSAIKTNLQLQKNNENSLMMLSKKQKKLFKRLQKNKLIQQNNRINNPINKLNVAKQSVNQSNCFIITSFNPIQLRSSLSQSLINRTKQQSHCHNKIIFPISSHENLDLSKQKQNPQSSFNNLTTQQKQQLLKRLILQKAGHHQTINEWFKNKEQKNNEIKGKEIKQERKLHRVKLIIILILIQIILIIKLILIQIIIIIIITIIK